MFCQKCSTHIINEIKQGEGHFRNTFMATYDTHPSELAPSWQPTIHIHCQDAIIDVMQWNDGLPKYVDIPAVFGGSDEQL